MIPQSVSDALARIKDALMSQGHQSAADAQTIADLNAKLATCEAECTAKDATIADLTQQLADVEAAIAALDPAANPAPAPAPDPAPPADGSGSPDVTP